MVVATFPLLFFLVAPLIEYLKYLSKIRKTSMFSVPSRNVTCWYIWYDKSLDVAFFGHEIPQSFPHPSINTTSALDWSRWDILIWSLFFNFAFDVECLISPLLSNKDKGTGDNSYFRTSSSSVSPSYAEETHDSWVNYFCIKDFDFSSLDRFVAWFHGHDFILNRWMKPKLAWNFDRCSCTNSDSYWVILIGLNLCLQNFEINIINKQIK